MCPGVSAARRLSRRPATTITARAMAKTARTPHTPRYFPASARTIAERAEHGTNAASIEASVRSPPRVVALIADSAGTVAPKAEEKRKRHTAVQAEPVKAPIDRECNSRHDADLLQQHEQ